MMTATEHIRVVVADDHAVLRAGLRALLAAEGDIDLVGEGATGEEAIRQIQAHSPDVAVMDISMPGLDGLAAIRRIAAMGVQTKIVVFTMHPEEEYLFPALEAGASAFVTKSSVARELVDAIRSAEKDEVYLSRRDTNLLLRRYEAGESGVARDRLHTLSQREREVFTLTAEGYTAAEIGRKLFLSPKTVETYRARVTRKLKLTHRWEVVQFALRTGLLRPP
jgi:two-component system response regulator NreC